MRVCACASSSNKKKESFWGGLFGAELGVRRGVGFGKCLKISSSQPPHMAIAKAQLDEDLEQKFEALCEDSDHNTKSEVLRDLIRQAYQNEFGDVDADEAVRAGMELYNPFEQDRDSLSTDELKELIQTVEAPVVNPAHAPSTLPRGNYAKRAMLAAAYRFEALHDRLSANDRLALCRRLLLVDGETAEKHVERATEILEQAPEPEGVPGADVVEEPVSEALEEVISIAEGLEAEDVLRWAGSEGYIELYRDHLETAEELVEALDDRDPRQERAIAAIGKLRAVLDEVDERIEAYDGSLEELAEEVSEEYELGTEDTDAPRESASESERAQSEP